MLSVAACASHDYGLSNFISHRRRHTSDGRGEGRALKLAADAAFKSVENAQAQLQAEPDARKSDHTTKTKATKSDAIFLACKEFVELREEAEELRDKVERRGKMQ